MKNLVITLYSAVAIALCAIAQAQDSRVNINIESQPMREALKNLGQQTGLSIVFRKDKTRWGN